MSQIDAVELDATLPRVEEPRDNAVAPGQIDTRMHRRDLDALGRRIGRPAADLLREHLDRRVPARRTGLPEEVAALLTFLASPAAGFINGEIVRVDGGEAAG